MLTMILTFAAISDVKTGKIPNVLIAAGVALGGAKAIWQYGSVGLYVFLIDFFRIFLPMYIFYLLKAVGAGDVKLFSVISAWLGTGWDILWIIEMSFLWVIFYLLAAVITQRKMKQRLLKSSVRLGPAVLLGWLMYIGGSNFG